jgi:FkbM family methyltransferase
MKHLKRIHTLWRISTLKEFIFILYHFFFTKKLVEKDIQLQRVLIFAISCSDKGYSLSLQGKDFIHVKGIGYNRKNAIIVRKYTRDILVFEGFFIADDYLQYVHRIKEKGNVNLIVDAGANIGCASIYLYSHFPDAKMICIEPESSNFEVLSKNIKLNHLENNTQCIKKALWNENKELELRRIDFSNDGFHVMSEGVTHEIIDKITTCTIPDLLKEYDEKYIDLLKIDIEGAEKVIFQDINHLGSFLPQTKMLILEVHQEYIADEEIVNILERFNFDIQVTKIDGQPSVIIAFNKGIHAN